jgi:hypothetical protein
MERALKLRDDNPAEFERTFGSGMSAGSGAVALYERGKQAAQRTQGERR